MVQRFVPFVGLAALSVGCSLLAPGDDEYLGGSSSGGSAGAGTAGAAGSASGGTSSGGTSSGGTSSGGTSSGGTASGGTASGGTSSGGTASGGTSSGGTSSGGTSSGGTSSGGTSSGGGSGGTGGTCNKQTGTLAPRPVELYIILPRSPAISPNQWSSLTNQVSQFVGAQTSAGVSVGLQYLPPLAGAGACDGTGFGAPDVAFGLLPGNASALQTSLAAVGQTTGALLEGAANGFKTLGSSRVSQSPTTQLSVALIVITSWYGCTGAVGPVANIIGSAWPTFSTYAIRAGSGVEADCDAMALAGGTVNRLGSGQTTGVSQALSQAARPCQFALPQGVSASKVDLALNVAGQIPLPRRTDATGCGTENGWFVSPNSSDTAALCPVSCRNAIAVFGASVSYATTCP